MRNAVLAAVVSCAFFTLGWAGPADASIRKTLNIPAESLSDALRTLAKDRQFEVLYRAEAVRDLRTDGAVGEYTNEEALKQLLKGTGLLYKYLDSNTVTIYPVSASASNSQPASVGTDGNADTNGGGKKTSQDFRVAQVDQGKGAGAAAVGNTTNSENSNSPSSGLSEIIVTAQKRSERLIDVPMSIAALGADQLRQQEITSIDDLNNVVPDLAISSQGRNRTIELRGIANTFGGSSPLIGLYVDEADATSSPLVQLELNAFDLDRIEVLRGPQGTLYGEGSAGGTIRFITNKPVLNQFQVGTDVSAAGTAGGSPSSSVNAVVNAPIIDDVLAFRVAGSFDHRGGWIDEPGANQSNFNTQDRADIRAEGLLQATSNVAINAMAIVHRNHESTNQGDYPETQDNYTQQFGLATVPVVNDDYNLYNLTISDDLGSVRLLNTTTYFDQRKETENYGYPLPFGSTIYGVYINPDLWHTNGLTEELRASSEGNGPWQWTVGGFYRRYKWDEYLAYNFGLPASALPEPALIFPYHDVSKSYAGFGDTSYRLFDRLTIGAGVRYYSDNQDYSTGVPQTGRFHSADPRFYAQFKVSDELNIYASAAKGFRTGGFNAQSQPTYQPENVWTYEVGTKASLIDHRVSAELTGFYSSYTNYQIFGIPDPNDPINITSNAGKVRVDGVEWNFSVQPVEAWRLGVNGNYTDAVFTKINTTSSAYQVGDKVDFVPPYQFGLYLQNDFALAGHPSYVRLDYNEMGRQTERNRSLGPLYFYESDVIHKLDLRAEVDWTKSLSLAVFAQNVLNQHGFVDPLQDRIRPLTIGVEIRTLFQ